MRKTPDRQDFAEAAAALAHMSRIALEAWMNTQDGEESRKWADVSASLARVAYYLINHSVTKGDEGAREVH